MSSASPSTALHERPVSTLRGVGAQLALTLSRLGIHHLEDLLFHLPFRYQDRTRLTPIAALQPHDDVVIEGVVRGADIVFGRRRSLLVRVQDNTGLVSLRFFHFSTAQKNALAAGVRIRCFGEVRRGASGPEFYHPEYRVLQGTDAVPLEQHLTPVYSITEGISQTRLRQLIAQALGMLAGNTLRDGLPLDVLPPAQRINLAQAVQYLHQPPVDVNVAELMSGEHPFRQRLALEELTAHHLSLRRLREKTRVFNAAAFLPQVEMEARFLQAVGFALTGAQQRVMQEIYADIAQPQPMLRLVQGDVGSGKTVVAALAALRVTAAKKQVAIMAPTEILAEQHFLNFSRWYEPLGIRVALLTSRMKTRARAELLQSLANGELDVVIGTHALFQPDVIYHDLALVIIDEQHRFGVHQRMLLREKAREGFFPHQLIMTATPIPRTLAMSSYADLDCSVIDELPPGRIPVNTVLVDNTRRSTVIDRVRAACAEGRQAYWVCTLIEESDVLECQAAEATAQALALALPEFKVGLVHGRLTPTEKKSIMQSFQQREIQILVATTVIEVGVDVPNASLMIIENPERLGLAQLHQLRGRVGRGTAASHCVLLYGNPLGQHAKARLAVMRATHDGFVIAEKDLELRGPGEVLGTRQTGAIEFRMADIQRDAHLLPQVKTLATQLIKQPALTDILIRRWIRDGEQYANA